jgi:hypothetical protein
MLLKARAIGLGLLVLLVAGAIASAVASAEPGPFWNHRQNPGEGNGLKVSLQSPESFYGTNGQQPVQIRGMIGTTPFILQAAGVKLTGTIWNNGMQGQIKLRMKFTPFALIEPKVPGCQPEVSAQPGARNLIYFDGHLAWKWNGEVKQLVEQPQLNQVPDIYFVPPGTQIQQDAKEGPKEGTVAEIKFAPAGSCSVLAGEVPLTGDMTGHLLQPENVNQWSNIFRFATPEGTQLQHIWNGKEFVGGTVGLFIAGNPASLIGEYIIETIRQEIAIFEK